MAENKVPRIYFFGAAALMAAALASFMAPVYAASPLAALVALTLASPYFPGWQMFLYSTMRGNPNLNAVALTFDDGPDPETTPLVLNMLKRHGIRAAFFVIGEKARLNPELTRRIIAEGHSVGNHTMGHDVFVMLRGRARLEAEIAGCSEVLAGYGIRALAFRPPAGIVNPLLGPTLGRLGLSCVMFSRRGLDWGNRRIKGISRNVLKGLRAGDIIMLHDRAPENSSAEDLIEQMEAVIEGVREKGLSFEPLERVIGREVMARGLN